MGQGPRKVRRLIATPPRCTIFCLLSGCETCFLVVVYVLMTFCWLVYPTQAACVLARSVLALKLHSVGLDGHIHGLVSPFGIHIMMELRPGAETISVTKAWLGEPPWGPTAESFAEQGSWPGSRVRVGWGWGESPALTGTDTVATTVLYSLSSWCRDPGCSFSCLRLSFPHIKGIMTVLQEIFWGPVACG